MIPPKPSSTEFHFDEAAADRAVRFFEICLIHTKGEWAGQPLKLSDWQAEKIIRPLFGWKRKDGTRRYRTAYIQIPRKAGKSTLSAGIALYLASQASGFVCGAVIPVDGGLATTA